MTKKLILFLAVGVIFAAPVFGQTSEMTGTVVAVSTSTITVQSGTAVWDIKRTSTTSVDGTLKVGSTVTVKYNTPDGQKREGPVTTTVPTATPSGN